MITSKTGSSPPFRYAAVQATMDADGAWTQVGGAAYNNGGTGGPVRQCAFSTHRGRGYGRSGGEFPSASDSRR